MDGTGASLVDEFERHRRLEAAAERIVVERGGRRTIWRRWGSGEPLILVHGGSGSWTHWTRNIDVLATERTVLALDVPGCGESDPPESADAPTIVASILRDIDTLLGVNAKIDLVGFSYGGALSGEMTVLSPGRIRQLVLVGSGGLHLVRAPRAPMVRWRGLDPEAQAEAHRKNLATLMIAEPDNIDALAVALQAANASSRSIDNRPITRSIHLEASLVGVGVPVSGIWGARDVTISGNFVACASLLRSFDPNAELIVIPDAGHWVQYENPALFNGALPRLLNARH